MSRRISLSPFPTLRHHSGTIPGPSITFQAFYHISITLLPFQFTPFLTPPPPSTFPPFTTVSGITVSLRNSPFLSVPRFSPLFSVSIRILFLSAILCFYLYPVSILSFSVSARRSAGQSCSSNITINRHIVLSHFAVHLRFFSVYKPVYLGSLDFSL